MVAADPVKQAGSFQHVLKSTARTGDNKCNPMLCQFSAQRLQGLRAGHIKEIRRFSHIKKPAQIRTRFFYPCADAALQVIGVKKKRSRVEPVYKEARDGFCTRLPGDFIVAIESRYSANNSFIRARSCLQ